MTTPPAPPALVGVKTEPDLPRPRYRNETVFRSAQQLITARPPAPVRTSKGGTRALGALALLIVGIFIGRNWPHSLPDLIDPPSTRTDDAPTNAAPTAPEVPTRDASHAVTSRPKPLAPKSPPRSAAMTETLADASADAFPAPQARSTRSNADSTANTTAQFLTSITVFEPGLTLRGTLDTDDQAPLAVEFSLRRQDRAITGVVRYLSPDGKRTAANRVSGAITGHAVEIREIDPIWTTTPGVSDPRPAWRDLGRIFLFELPEETKEITGRWTVGTTQGTLSLHVATPW